MTDNTAEQLVDGEVVDESQLQINEGPPADTSKEWTTYITDQLFDSEFSNGAPTTAGLRRVCEKSFGEIIKSKSEYLNSSETRAAVTHHLTVQKYSNDRVIEVSACVDSKFDVIPAPYNKHLLSTACTSAEGKALRRAMKINIHTAEELAVVEDEDTDGSTSINDQQISVISMMCRRSDVNVAKLINSITTSKTKAYADVGYGDAKIVIKKVSEFQRTSVPEEFVGYKEDVWSK